MCFSFFSIRISFFLFGLCCFFPLFSIQKVFHFFISVSFIVYFNFFFLTLSFSVTQLAGSIRLIFIFISFFCLNIYFNILLTRFVSLTFVCFLIFFVCFGFCFYSESNCCCPLLCFIENK